MEYIKGLKGYQNTRAAAVTFGKFDGLHRGHQKLIRAVRELGIQENIDSAVCAFDMSARGMLMTKEEQELHLENEVDYLVDCPFTKEFSAMSAEEFIRDVIRDIFHADFVVVGTDFRFGYGKRGDIYMLAAYAEEYGYELLVIEKERYAGEIISSTLVKKVLKEGKVELAGKLLGYSYGVFGTAQSGRGAERVPGIPVFDMLWPKEKLAPPQGVYLCLIYAGGRRYCGVAGIGSWSYVVQEEELWMQGFLLDDEEDVCGQEVRIELVRYVRPEQKFSDEEELRAYIRHDIACGKEYFGIEE